MKFTFQSKLMHYFPDTFEFVLKKDIACADVKMLNILRK